MKFWRFMAAAFVLLAACGGNKDDDKVATKKHTTTTERGATTTTFTDESTTTTAAGATTTTTTKRGAPATTGATSNNTTATSGAVKVKATKMATLARPIAMTVRSGEPDNVYVAQKGGIVKRLRVNGASASVDGIDVLNIADRISSGDEQGLLGIAFAPNGNTLYADYTDTSGNLRVSAFPYAAGRAAADGEKTILNIPHPQYANHNGGNIAFGPDGHLWVGTGDGGGAGDPFGNAQNVNSLLGKLLRISPNPAGGYTVPSDNPFVGVNGARAEVYYYGLRNPWRWSFDGNALWIGDVGQNQYEEVDWIRPDGKTANFGWNKREGRHAFNGGAAPAGAVDPLIEVSHSNGSCAIVGGFVYRGDAIPRLRDTYLFTDNCRTEIVTAANDGRGVARDLGIKIEQASSFGQDAHRELWVLSLAGGAYRLGPG
jgi:glucose/arabinose dehydrogenase